MLGGCRLAFRPPNAVGISAEWRSITLYDAGCLVFASTGAGFGLCETKSPKSALPRSRVCLSSDTVRQHGMESTVQREKQSMAFFSFMTRALGGVPATHCA